MGEQTQRSMEQTRGPGTDQGTQKRPIKYSLTEILQRFRGHFYVEKIVFSTNGKGIIGYPFVEKITSIPASYIIQKLTQNNHKPKCNI